MDSVTLLIRIQVHWSMLAKQVFDVLMRVLLNILIETTLTQECTLKCNRAMIPWATSRENLFSVFPTRYGKHLTVVFCS